MAFGVRYMGSKRSLAARIAARISDQNPSADVLDVFSGMCAVGSELAPRHTVFTNDVHAFAETIAHALFVSPVLPPTSLQARDELAANFRLNLNALRGAIQDRLKSEAEAIARSGDAGGWKVLLRFDESERELSSPHPLPNLPPLDCYRRDPTTFPFSLATSYFASGYFGLQQCAEIDSLRYAIMSASSEHQSYYLSALLQSMSHCAAAPGHFAQFIVPRDRTNTRYVAKMRSRSVVERFYDALDNFPTISCLNRLRNRSFKNDATELLAQVKDSLSENLVIYADPPYSRAQYSRYYHVLETIVLYDYPDSTGKGRYRSDRHQTAFSQKAQVERAFRSFFEAAVETNASLYLSYPTNGLLYSTGVSLPDLLREFYSKVELDERVPLNHSTLGASSGYASVPVFEDVYYASS